jgi:hypothetical protein
MVGGRGSRVEWGHVMCPGRAWSRDTSYLTPEPSTATADTETSSNNPHLCVRAHHWDANARGRNLHVIGAPECHAF